MIFSVSLCWPEFFEKDDHSGFCSASHGCAVSVFDLIGVALLIDLSWFAQRCPELALLAKVRLIEVWLDSILLMFREVNCLLLLLNPSPFRNLLAFV